MRVELINTLDSAAKATKILMTEAESDDKVFNQIRLTKISFDLGEFANGIRLLDSKKFETFLVLISEDSELSFSDFIFQANNLWAIVSIWYEHLLHKTTSLTSPPEATL